MWLPGSLGARFQKNQCSTRFLSGLSLPMGALGLLQGWEEVEVGSQMGSLSVTLLGPSFSLKNELFPI